MSNVEPKKYFTGVLINDSSLSFDPIEILIHFGVTLGTNFPLLRGVYKTLRKLDLQFVHKPLIGAEIVVLFDYEQQSVTIKRESEVSLTLPQFLQFLGKVDVAFAPILPLGTTVELDETMLPLGVERMFTEGEIGARVTLTGRKVPLQSGFDHYLVDYYGRLWPFGEMPGGEPIVISNMMIKRVIQEGYKDEWEERYSFDVLRATQVARQQISTAFMTTEDALRFYETFEKGKD